MPDPSPPLSPSRPAEAPTEAQAVDPALELLPWDTDFFGVRIARADLAGSELEQVIEAAQAAGVACVYLSARGDDPRTAELAIRRGARIVEFRADMDLDVRRIRADPDARVRLAGEEDREALLALAGGLADLSRFSADPRFSAERVRRMYELHIERCLDEGVVAVSAENPANMCALTLERSVAYVHLIHTDPAERQRWTAPFVLAAALREADVKRAIGAVNAARTGMLRNCQAVGFVVRRFRLLLHLWVDEISASPARPVP